MILIRILRGKIIAVLLGPMGVGVAGLYQGILDMIRSATGCGINFSAVRDIAEAGGNGDEYRIAQTIKVLRSWVWFTGLLSLTVAAVFSRVLSRYAFGAETYAWGIRVLSVCLLFMALSEGQLALLQGLRRLGMMARANVFGVVAGFCISVPLYWFMGVNGIVPAILFTTVASLLLSWYYARQIPVQVVTVSPKETVLRGFGMVRLGFFLVITGFMMTTAMYLVRGFISRQGDIEDVGQFQAAWVLSSMYLATVLQAMGADYFPRLSAVNRDDKRVAQLVNEQTEVALLVAGPMIVGMLSFISVIVFLLYSSEFTGAVSILHWQLVGMFFKVVAWPIGFIMLAKGRGGIFICTELCWNVMYVGLITIGWRSWGLEATGIAFLGAFVVYVPIVAAVGRMLTGFTWSRDSLKYVIIFGTGTVLAFVSSKLILGIAGYIAGGILSVAAVSYSWLELQKFVNVRSIVTTLFRR